MADNGEYDFGTFYIRYGPAVIFSNIVPGLDANFINPKYTENTPYTVKKTPESGHRAELTKDLKDKGNTNLDDFVADIYDLMNVDMNITTKSEMQVMILVDEEYRNCIQFIFMYKDERIIVDLENWTDDGGIDGYDINDDVIIPLCTLLTDGENDGEAMYCNKTFTYSELEALYNRDVEDCADAIDLLIEHGTENDNIEWRTYNYYSAKEDKSTTDFNKDLEDLGYFDYHPGHLTSVSVGQTFSHKLGSYGGDIFIEITAVGTISPDGKIPCNYTMYQSYSIIDNLNTGEERLSISAELQATVSKWYKALRAIALVGLLSVLVYVGIRILISSTGQEKAKYKKMIADWLAALCLLFILQYIMAFIMEITNKITQVLSVSAVGVYGEDVLMSKLRNELGVALDFSTIFVELIMYLALVIYTVMFTIQYLKRVVYIAFFTMIAPLIALTYPLDKIKDGQAQAFSFWLREYIFNALLQPMHLLLYVIFVSSAMNFVTAHPIYALVVIGFLLPAEKFFRKMFGFDKAQSSNQLGAAAGGALIMNAINKMGQNSGKKAAGGINGAGDSGNSSASTPRYVSAPKDTTSGNNIHNAKQSAFDGDGSVPDATSAPRPGITGALSGAKTLAGHYFNTKNGKNIAKGLGRTARKVGVGAVGAATLGTLGLAAGIATGDMGNALKYGAAGATAGYMGANQIGDKATAFEKTNREIFQEGRYGTDEYNTRKTISQLKGDNDFNRAFNSLENVQNKEALIRQFHTSGITSSADIKKAVNIMSKTKVTPAEIITAQRINQEAKKYGMKKKDIEDRLNKNGNIDTNTMMNLIDML